MCNDESVGYVRSLVREQKPDIIMLHETKLCEEDDPTYLRLWREPWCCLKVPSCGKSGRMVIAWDSTSIEVNNHLIGVSSLTVLCNMISTGFEWMHTVVYGPSRRAEKDAFIEELDNIRMWSSLPWCLGGDFNLVRFLHERKGGGRLNRYMVAFDDFVDRSNLVDYNISGADFTWANAISASRIDRFLSSIDWHMAFPDVREIALPKFNSDHRVIILDCGKKVRGPLPFRFELMWFECESLPDLIDVWWKSFRVDGSLSYAWWYKMKLLKDKLRNWNRDVFGRINFLLQEKSKEIDTIDLKEESVGLNEDEEAFR
ncbi:Atp-dependent dna helicase, partial [Thalictrum thalictroides]